MTREDVLCAAEKHGGKRVLRVVVQILACGMTFPLAPKAALRVRGVGRKVYLALKEAGLLLPEVIHPFDGLSTRAWNVLENLGLKNQAEVLEAYESGKLTPHREGGCRNYGWGTHKEIARWLGKPEPEKMLKALFCPHCNAMLVMGGHWHLRRAREVLRVGETRCDK